MPVNRNQDWIWWVVIIALLCSVTPVGLIALFIYLNRDKSKAKRRQIPEKTGQTQTNYTFNEAMRSAGSAVDDAMRSVSDAINDALGTKPGAKPGAKSGAQPQPGVGYQVAAKPHKPKKPISRGWAKCKMIAGGIITGIFSFAAVMEFFDELQSLFYGWHNIVDMLSELIPLGVFACLGAVLTLWGYYGTQKARRFDRYQGLIQPERAALSVHALADALELKYNRVCDDLDEMIDRGYFAFAYLDRAHGRLILSPEYVNLYDTAPRAADATPAAPQSTAAPDTTSENEMLTRIRQANDLIANRELSGKLDEIEQLTRKIFKLLEERPEKAESLHSFTGYYLPQTLKITEAYARMEAQGVEGDNITEAKQKITAALDKLVEGYRQQLDQLFADDVVDITADIAVIEQMLARDGLTADELQPERRK